MRRKSEPRYRGTRGEARQNPAAVEGGGRRGPRGRLRCRAGAGARHRRNLGRAGRRSPPAARRRRRITTTVKQRPTSPPAEPDETEFEAAAIQGRGDGTLMRPKSRRRPLASPPPPLAALFAASRAPRELGHGQAETAARQNAAQLRDRAHPPSARVSRHAAGQRRAAPSRRRITTTVKQRPTSPPANPAASKSRARPASRSASSRSCLARSRAASASPASRSSRSR